MFFSSIVYICIVMAMDGFNVLNWLAKKLSPEILLYDTVSEVLDEDVIAEQERLKQNLCEDDVLSVRGLRKIYGGYLGKRANEAVKGV